MITLQVVPALWGLGGGEPGPALWGRADGKIPFPKAALVHNLAMPLTSAPRPGGGGAPSRPRPRERYPSGSMPLHPPGFIEPCLPTGSRTAPTGPQWAYEIKHDGFRFICHRDGDRVRVFSRTGHEWGAQLPAIAATAR
jgi:ATP-dependent DNA ligase